MKPFVPHKLPIQDLDWVKFVVLIGEANRELAKFDSLLSNIPNPNVLLSPLMTNEAVLSSRIEGTQATLEDVLKFEATPSDETSKYNDIQEVINYRRAISEASEKLDRLPLSGRLIKEIHRTLLAGTRGKNKTPGEYRTGQVFIGQKGVDMESASYIPPEPQTIADHFSNLERYIHYNEKDDIVQLAIIHAQFEIIHPFWDGNGRTGRIILPLFLYYKKVISSPNFYLSEYFEKNRDTYYSGLNTISKSGKWEDWIIYFLNAIIIQSALNRKKVEAILNLHRTMLDEIMQITHSQYTHKIVDFIFSNPWFESTKFREKSNISKSVGSRILTSLTEHNILQIVRRGSGRKPTLYIFPKLLEIVK